MTTFTKTGLDPLKKIKALTEGLEVAWFALVDVQGFIKGRPLPLPDDFFDGNFWFFIERPSLFSEALASGQKFNLVFSSEADDRYLTCLCQAQVSESQLEKSEHWSDRMLSLYSDGVQDPDLILVKAKIENAEFWDPFIKEMVALDCDLLKSQSYQRRSSVPKGARHLNPPEV